MDGARRRRTDGRTLLRADLLVTRNGRRYVAEVKTGRTAPRLDCAATRRQLLEYRIAFGVDGVLLVDAESDCVIVVELGSLDAAADEARSRAMSIRFPRCSRSASRPARCSCSSRSRVARRARSTGSFESGRSRRMSPERATTSERRAARGVLCRGVHGGFRAGTRATSCQSTLLETDPMISRASLLALLAIGTVGVLSSAACSSNNDRGGTGTCDSEILCRLAGDAGLCSGPVVPSGACQPCPAGYVDESSCTNDDAGTTDAGKDGASRPDGGRVSARSSSPATR